MFFEAIREPAIGSKDEAQQWPENISKKIWN